MVDRRTWTLLHDSYSTHTAIVTSSCVESVCTASACSAAVMPECLRASASLQSPTIAGQSCTIWRKRDLSYDMNLPRLSRSRNRGRSLVVRGLLESHSNNLAIWVNHAIFWQYSGNIDLRNILAIFSQYVLQYSGNILAIFLAILSCAILWQYSGNSVLS
jgi:hypothetical protein